MRRLLPLLALLLLGCTTTAVRPPISNGALPDPGAMGEDGFPVTGDAKIRKGEQPSLDRGLALLLLREDQETKDRVKAARAMTGLDALSDGMMSAFDAQPRATISYALAAGDDALLGALGATPQSARLTNWIAHPEAVGFCYFNDALSLIDGIDRFINSEALTNDVALSGPLQRGVIDNLQQVYELNFDQDLTGWWDGEMVILWLGQEYGAPLPVIIAGSRKPWVSEDKVRQMLAMYYFFTKGDRGVFATDRSGETPLQVIQKVDGATAQMDIAYVQGTELVVIGSKPALHQLFATESVATESASDPSAGFLWDATVLKQQPRSIALGFEGGQGAADALFNLTQGGLGLIPGAGRDSARSLGNLFEGEGITRLYFDLQPDRFAWTLMGPAAAQPEMLGTLWNGALGTALIGFANSSAWDEAASENAFAEPSTFDPFGNSRERSTRRRPNKPFWRDRR